eukprot:753809-Hanusia_phi.AAC.5
MLSSALLASDRAPEIDHASHEIYSTLVQLPQLTSTLLYSHPSTSLSTHLIWSHIISHSLPFLRAMLP